MPISSMKSPKKLTFKIPEGLDLEGKKDGEELEVVATLKLEDGKLCLVEVNGIELPGYKEEDDEEESSEKPTGTRFTAAMSEDE